MEKSNIFAYFADNLSMNAGLKFRVTLGLTLLFMGLVSFQRFLQLKRQVGDAPYSPQNSYVYQQKRISITREYQVKFKRLANSRTPASSSVYNKLAILEQEMHAKLRLIQTNLPENNSIVKLSLPQKSGNNPRPLSASNP